MSAQFTKSEAIEFLGETVRFKKRWSHKYEGDKTEYQNTEFDFINDGELARVDFIKYIDGAIVLILATIRDDNLRSFNKSMFEEYCVLLKSEITNTVLF